MKTISPSVSVAALLTSLALAGCVGGGELAASFTATSTDNITFSFDASASTGDIKDYIWDFGDGNLGQGKVVEHTYTYLNGNYDVTLELVAADGTIAKAVEKVKVGEGENQLPMLLMSVDRRWVRPDEVVTFDATATHDMDGDPVRLHWDFNYAIQEFEVEKWVNLGKQQYQAPAPMDPVDDQDPNATGRSANDPAKRLEQAVTLPPQEAKPRHGGSENAYGAGTNLEYDGTVNASSPLLTYAWTAPGEYYLKLTATDIKGASSIGFLAMKVTDDAPNPTNVTVQNGTITYSGPALQEDGDFTNKWSTRYRLDYPTHVVVDVTVARADVGEAPLMLYLCGAQFTDAQCSGSALGEDGPSGSQLHGEFQHSSPDAKDFKTVVIAEDETPSAANIDMTIVTTLHYDTNPWFTLEGAGGGGGHAGH